MFYWREAYKLILLIILVFQFTNLQNSIEITSKLLFFNDLWIII
jgi:hypothetical protein